MITFYEHKHNKFILQNIQLKTIDSSLNMKRQQQYNNESSMNIMLNSIIEEKNKMLFIVLYSYCFILPDTVLSSFG